MLQESKVENKNITNEEYFEFITPVPLYNHDTSKYHTHETEYYSKIYAKHKDQKFFLSWNWCAGLFLIFWCLYRKCYLLAFWVGFTEVIIINILSFSYFLWLKDILKINYTYTQINIAILFISFILVVIIFGFIANCLYQNQVIKWIKSKSINKKGVDGGINYFLILGMGIIIDLASFLDNVKLSLFNK